MATPFDTIVPGDTKKSFQWYQSQIKKLATVNPRKLMSQTSELVTNILPGQMYMFFYEAKLKDRLPYYDQFPLVLPFRKVPGGFYGINLHYLPYMMRFKILGILMEYTNDNTVGADTRILLSWKTLNSASQLAPVKHCVKHYLYEQMESKFLTIGYPDWITASQLPVERFVGASKLDVWKETRTKY